MSDNEAPRVVWIHYDGHGRGKAITVLPGADVERMRDRGWDQAIIIDDATKERWRNELVLVQQMVATLPANTLAYETSVKVLAHYRALLKARP